MRFAVCDDDKTVRESIVSLLEEYAVIRKLPIDYDTYEHYEALAPRIRDYDLFFLDQRMPDIDGLTFAGMIRETAGNNKGIIFVSAYREIVFDTFAVRTHRFLTKPIQRDKFFEALDAFFQTDNMRLIVKTQHSIHAIPCEEVYYVEVIGKLLYIHAKGGTLPWRRTMASVENELRYAGFFRVHRSFLVNLRAIRTFDKTHIELKNGKIIQIGAKHYHDFRQAYEEIR